MATAHVVCVHWFSPFGHLNGTNAWNDYRYAGALTGTIKNSPTVLGVTPEAAVTIAGDASNDFHARIADHAARDLRLMKDAGFDNVFLDMLPAPNWSLSKTLRRPATVGDATYAEPLVGFVSFQKYLQAAESVGGISVGVMADVRNVSGDYPSGYTLNVTEWTNVLKGVIDNLGSSPALYRIDGKPVVIHFGSDKSAGFPPDAAVLTQDGGWLTILKNLRSTGRTLYFVADYRPNSGTPSVNLDWQNDVDVERRADALYMFAPAGTEGFMRDYQHAQANVFGIPRWWTVSPGYYNAGQDAWTQPSFGRIHETYLQAIADDVDHMVALTWNDFGEDTDICLSANKGRCLIDVFGFYNRWFKTRAEPAPIDKVILAYPLRIPGSVSTDAVNYGSYGSSPAFSPAKMFYWASVPRARSLVVAGVGSVSIPAGTSYGEVGTVTAGTLRATLDGRTRALPGVAATTTETQRGGTGGLEYRYVDLVDLLQVRHGGELREQ